MARAIGKNMGSFMEVNQTASSKSMRIRVMLDVSKPLVRGTRIGCGNGASKWIDIKYERMPIFCFTCGRIGHVDKDCGDISYTFGEWLERVL